MPSLVSGLQSDIVNSPKSVTEILRTAKLISAKLGLTDISELIDSELGGYNDKSKIPTYREITGGTLWIFNPVRGWVFAGNISAQEYHYRTPQPVSDLEELAKAKFITTNPPGKFELSEPFLMQCPQQVRHSPIEIKRILEAVKEQILNWAIELEQRGIVGENMSFDKQEKQKAQNQTFHIQHFTGILGDVKDSNVALYDYGSIYELLRNHNVPRDERNQIEDILDGLKQAKPNEKASLLEKGKDWIVKNQEFLGASASIIRKALGL